MKRFLLLLLFSTLLSSACKTSVCECTTGNNQIPEPGGTGSFQVKGSEKKRKKDCDGHSVPVDANGNYTNCVLK